MTEITETQADRDARVIDWVRANLASGYYFTLIDVSETSADRMSYHGPLSHRNWAQMVKALGAYAQNSRRAADTAAALLPALAPGLTRPQTEAAIARRLAVVVAGGWHDWESASGPEAGRPSAHQHDTTLTEAIRLALLFAELEAAAEGRSTVSLGWVLERLAKAEVAAHRITAWELRSLSRVAKVLDPTAG